MRSGVSVVAIRKAGGFDRASLQAAYDTFSEIIDRASAERFKANSILPAAAVMRDAAIAAAPFDPETSKKPDHHHLNTEIFMSAGPPNKPFATVFAKFGASPQGYFEEYGTSHQPARPWWRPAIASSKGTAAGIIAAGITRVITGRG